MLILYVKDNCAFSAKVRDAAKDLGITLTEKNIKNPIYLAELIEKGGRQQTPYFVDDETGTALYESFPIIEYLKTRVSNATRDT